MMGIQKEVRKLSGSNVLAYICSMRTAQGYEQWGSSTQEERLDIVSRWHERKSELQSVRQKILEEGPDGQEVGRLSPKGFLQTRHLSFEERKRLQEKRRIRREQEKSKTYGDHGTRCSFCQKTYPHPHSDHMRLPQEDKEASGISGKAVHTRFEPAIRFSGAAASKGSLEEGLMIERALRATMSESQNSSPNEQEVLDRAIPNSAGQSGSDSGTEDDEDFQLAIKLSKAAYEENELKNKMEEDIVIEYIQKQSFAEDEYRTSMQDRQKDISSNAVVDGDLKSATGET
jgi:hypothetical protein